MVQVDKSLPIKDAIGWGLLQPVVWFILTIVLMALLFLIGHNLNSVENWMYLNSWEILLGVKFVALFTWIRWRGVKLSNIYQAQPCDLENKGLYLVILFLAIIFSIIFLSGELVSFRKLLTLEGIVAVFAKLLFYSVDLYVLVYLFSHLKQSSIYKRVLVVLVMSLVCMASHSLILSIAHSVDLYYLANLLFGFSLIFILGHSVMLAIVFHCAISVPFNLATLHLNEPYAPWIELTRYISELEYFALLFFFFISFTILSKSLLSTRLK